MPRATIFVLSIGLWWAGCGEGTTTADGGGRDAAGADAARVDASGEMYCPDYTPPAAARLCTDNAGCEAGYYCGPAGQGCCPVNQVAARACEADTDCNAGEVCEEFRPTMPCTTGIGTECRASCNDGRACVDGTCGSEGHCVSLACPTDWTCGDNHDCTPTDAAADEHGCVVRACTDGTECSCGACVNGYCQSGPGQCTGACACAAPDTLIATPDGEREIATLAVGDLVYSVDEGAIVVAPLVAVGSRAAPVGHEVVRVELASGRVFEMSPGHPTADGLTLGALSERSALGEAEVVSVSRAPYVHPLTYDILPATDSGAYFAAGALVGSTLR